MPEVRQGSVVGNITETVNRGADVVSGGIDSVVGGINQGVNFVKKGVLDGLSSVGIEFPGATPPIVRGGAANISRDIEQRMANFKQVVRKVGLGRSSAWYVAFPQSMFINGYTYPGASTSELDAFAYEEYVESYARSIHLPDINVNVKDDARLSINHSPHNLASGIGKQTFTINFYDSSDGYIHAAMYRWASQYRSGPDIGSRIAGYAQTQGQIRSGFEQGAEGGGRTIDVFRFNINGTRTTRYQLLGVYPIKVTSPKLESDADSDLITFSVEFATIGMYPTVVNFDSSRVYSAQPGGFLDPATKSRGGLGGLIERIRDIYRTGQDVQRGIRYAKRAKSRVTSSIKNIREAIDSDRGILDTAGTVFNETERAVGGVQDLGRQVNGILTGGIFRDRR
jgi:hypothetical protein